jgi:hypothetical protein
MATTGVLLVDTGLDRSVAAEFGSVIDRLGWGNDDLPHLRRSYELTEAAIKIARDRLGRLNLDGRSVDAVGLGSMGRFELSEESDFDFLVVCHGSEPEDLGSIVREVDDLRRFIVPGIELREPGSTGLFGTAIRDADLYQQIGLLADTNDTHSRRSLVFEESVSLHDPLRHRALLRTMASRYVEALPFGQSSVPRFLVNDLARYWRQLTVDYQAKSETGSPSTVRRLKLLGPRKFTFAASILPLLTLDQRGIRKEDVVDRLVEVFESPPTLRFLSEIEFLGQTDDAVLLEGRRALLAMDEMNGLFTDGAWRAALATVQSKAEAESLGEYKLARGHARDLQESLERIFFSPTIESLTRKYLVF